MATLIHGTGRLTSDSYVSPAAHKAWKSFRDVSGLGGKIGKYTTDPQPKEAAAFEQDRHHVFIKDKSKLDHNKIFHPVDLTTDLAASEFQDGTLRKNISSLEDIRNILETKDEPKTLEVPEHQQIMWAVPIHRWK